MATNARIDDLRRRLDREPGSRLFAQLAEELRKAGELDEAIRVARDGLARHPGYASARMTLGRALFDLGDLRAARVELDAVLAGAPDNILAGRMLAEALEGLGLHQEAARRYRVVLALAPGDKHAASRLEALALVTRQPASPWAERSAGAGPLPSTGPIALPLEPPALAPFPERRRDSQSPVPLAAVEEEDFELERPTETTARLMSIPVPAVSRFEADAGLEAAVDGTAPTLPFVRAPEFDERPRPAQPAEAPPEGGPGPAEAPAGAPPAPGERPPLSSPTLAELYFTQGVPEKAAEVYQEILQREPWNERARRRLDEIEAALSDAAAEAAAAVPAASLPPASRREALERAIARLEVFLRAVREGRTKWPASPTR